MTVRQLIGDCREMLRTLEPGSIAACITSPPYYALRSYVADDDPLKPFEIGLEKTPELYISHLVDVFREVRRVLRPDGTLWVNLGDSYAGSGKGPSNSIQGDASQIGPSARKARGMNNLQSTPTTWIPVGAGLKSKDLMMMPFRVAMALQADGWWLRSVIPWLKRSSMPESVSDRPSTAVEYIFLLAKSPRYFFDADAIRVRSGSEMSWDEYNAKKSAGTWPSGGITNYAGAHKKDGGQSHPSGRSFRNSDFFFQTWQGLLLDEQDDPLALIVNPAPYSGAHFATFPPKLVEPMVKASTSERGQCSACGAPWVRVVKKAYRSLLIKGDHAPEPDTFKGTMSRPRERREDGTFLPRGDDARPDESTVYGANGSVKRFGDGVDVATTGWRPSCAHADATPVTQTVLDPFGGSGTTALVADRLGRNAVLIDLQDTYTELARQRVTSEAPMFTEWTA